MISKNATAINEHHVIHKRDATINMTVGLINNEKKAPFSNGLFGLRKLKCRVQLVHSPMPIDEETD